MEWTDADEAASRKQGWGVYRYGATYPGSEARLYRRRGFNRWKDNAEFLRWFEQQVIAGDELCIKARTHQVFRALTK